MTNLKNTKESKFKPQKQWISTKFVLYHHKISLRDENHWSHKTHTKLCINCSNDSKLNLENIKIKMMILCIVAVKTIAKGKQRRSKAKKKQNFCAYKRKSQIVNHKLKWNVESFFLLLILNKSLGWSWCGVRNHQCVKAKRNKRKIQ